MRAGQIRKELQAAFTATRGKAGQCTSAARSSRQTSPALRGSSGGSALHARTAFPSPSQFGGWRIPEELWGGVNAVAAACRRSFSGHRSEVICEVGSCLPQLGLRKLADSS